MFGRLKRREVGPRKCLGGAKPLKVERGCIAAHSEERLQMRDHVVAGVY